MMPAALDRLIRRLDPDPTPTIGPNTPTGHHPTMVIENDEPLPAEPDETPCTCKVFDAIGQNPECPEHPWWSHDNDVLHLADLTRELGSAWEAAIKKFGEAA